MSLSLRRWLLEVYTQKTTNDAGYATELYVSTGVKYWANIIETGARERLRTMTAHHEHDAVLDVADGAVIPENCLLVITDSGFSSTTIKYQVRGVIPRPLARSQWLVCQRSDAPLMSATFIDDGTRIYDGSATYGPMLPAFAYNGLGTIYDGTALYGAQLT